MNYVRSHTHTYIHICRDITVSRQVYIPKCSFWLAYTWILQWVRWHLYIAKVIAGTLSWQFAGCSYPPCCDNAIYRFNSEVRSVRIIIKAKLVIYAHAFVKIFHFTTGCNQFRFEPGEVKMSLLLIPFHIISYIRSGSLTWAPI